VTAARRAAFGLGANLGDREATLQSAVDQLAAADGVLAVGVSAVYETTPVGGPPGQPQYLNAVLVVQTALPAMTLLELAHRVEQAHGRVRLERWGPRTLDVDLLAVGAETSANPDLVLPHPLAHTRAFVLAPWADADPGFDLVGHGRVQDLVAALDRTGGSIGVRRRPDVVLRLPGRPGHVGHAGSAG
jgi:2-amino-4-hydroxy-6-hydroxymethyldihydropteridine diphosphokinase